MVITEVKLVTVLIPTPTLSFTITVIRLLVEGVNFLGRPLRVLSVTIPSSFIIIF